MKAPKLKLAAWFAAGLAVGSAAFVMPHLARADAHQQGEAARLQRLEDRQAIQELFTEYGATLDRRDFAAFGQLFAEDAVYVSGPQPTRGRAAIQAMLEKTITSNPSHLPTPDFHLYFNPSIHVEGDRATAQSKGAYVIPDNQGGARMVFFVSYEDVFTRRDGRWMFQTRTIHTGIPGIPR